MGRLNQRKKREANKLTDTKTKAPDTSFVPYTKYPLVEYVSLIAVLRYSPLHNDLQELTFPRVTHPKSVRVLYKGDIYLIFVTDAEMEALELIGLTETYDGVFGIARSVFSGPSEQAACNLLQALRESKTND